MTAPNSEPQLIVFFDGVCHLCDGFVDFALARDRTRLLTFAPLQGATAARLLDGKDRIALDSLVVLEKGKIIRESSAVLRVLFVLGGGWSFLAFVMATIPLFIRDRVYRLIARNRVRWFGQRKTCRLPTPEERGRLLE